MRKAVPRHEMADHPLPANVVKTLIDDEMVLDGTPRMNLASFVTTWMERECEDLMQDAARKNYIDIGTYIPSQTPARPIHAHPRTSTHSRRVSPDL